MVSIYAIVRDAGIEPAAFSMSMKRSATELIALFLPATIRLFRDNFNGLTFVSKGLKNTPAEAYGV